jgi:type I restriction enzyme S subunit
MTYETVALGDVCDLQNGFAFKSNLFAGSGLPILRISNIQKQGIDISNLVFFKLESYKENLDKYKIMPNDLLIAMSGGTTGKIGFNNTEDIFYLNQRVGKLSPKPLLDKQYLYYFLSTQVEKNLSISLGAAQPNLSSEQIKNMQILLPPLSVQKNIVKKLDAISNKIDRAYVASQANIKNAEALFQSYLTEVFEVKAKDSESCELNLLCNFLNGYAFKSTEAIESSNIQLLRMGNLYNDELDLTRSPVFYPNNFASLYSKFLIEVGDILISLTGTVGKRDYGYAVRVEELPVNLLLNQRILKIYDIKKTVINSDYLFYFLHSNMFLDDLYKSANGTRQANLSSDYIKKIKIPLIAIDEQNQVVNKLENIKNNCSLMKDSLVGKLANLAQLKQSVLQQAFNGELVKG